MAYKVDIGIEVHVQLTTKSKIFCTCANETAQKPNTNICQICSGYPGVLPVLNEEVINDAIKAGLATNSEISEISEFSRKHYFYPDLPKGYQITQGNRPTCLNGYVPIKLEDGSTKKIRLIRIHIEEDAGKNIHSSTSNESFVDLNRAGTPLLEIVTHPDISSSYEAKAYLKKLRQIVQYLGICSGNMEEGAFRADTNISIRPIGQETLGTRVELKNINSFKFIGDAIEYEIDRQTSLIESGQRIIQETRLWDTKDKKSISMRSKEEAADYRYFAEPDLPLLKIDTQKIEKIKKELPELPDQKLERLVKEHGLKEADAEILIDDLELGKYYEKAAQFTKSKHLINWILRNLLSYLKSSKETYNETNITPQKLAELVDLLDTGIINNRAAQEIFDAVAKTGKNPKDLVTELGLEQIGSTQEIETIIKEIIVNSPNQVAQYKSGQEKLFGFFVGQAMAKTKGKANPQIINDLLKKYLK
ncbi:Asp-tRNA(Asn)/Glu-tRNA(Gln) amidotransferase subunit GatB [Candidatus Dependentiae bacterium]|nr:Asp-tRNA(Asn)/Glu-tRNA(Gln) amidotransferase subunit GatB [Candidatus Dependentiae bacterium]